MKEYLKEAVVLIIVGIIAFGVIYFVSPSFKASIDNVVQGKPYVKIDGNNLVIDDFEYSYGTVGINELSGDFQTLNGKIYKLLKNKTGTYQIKINILKTDKYGNRVKETKDIGSIDANELNKYSSLEFWSKSAGIQTIILANLKAQTSFVAINNVPLDTISRDYSVTDTNVPYNENKPLATTISHSFMDEVGTTVNLQLQGFEGNVNNKGLCRVIKDYNSNTITFTSFDNIDIAEIKLENRLYYVTVLVPSGKDTYDVGIFNKHGNLLSDGIVTFSSNSYAQKIILTTP